MMTLPQRMERFSFAFVQAVAARAGYQVIEPAVDDDSVDGVIMSRRGRRPRVEFQLKATGQNIISDDALTYALPLKNYDDLRAETITPRILIVVTMPKEPDLWLSQNEEELVLRKCAYWHCLASAPERDNISSVTVHLPRSQILTPESLEEIMHRIEAGGTP